MEAYVSLGRLFISDYLVSAEGHSFKFFLKLKTRSLNEGVGGFGIE
jgi:hypothetical protein